MDRISNEKLNVEEAKLRFQLAMGEISFRSVVTKHPLAATGAVFAIGFLFRRDHSISAPLSLLSLANTIVRKL